MDTEAERKYEHTIDQIIVQLENLIMDILLTSIHRLTPHDLGLLPVSLMIHRTKAFYID